MATRSPRCVPLSSTGCGKSVPLLYQKKHDAELCENRFEALYIALIDMNALRPPIPTFALVAGSLPITVLLRVMVVDMSRVGTGAWGVLRWSVFENDTCTNTWTVAPPTSSRIRLQSHDARGLVCDCPLASQGCCACGLVCIWTEGRHIYAWMRGTSHRPGPSR